jgi:hypothetical protein
MSEQDSVETGIERFLVEAERLTRAVVEPELRRVAYDRVLERLLKGTQFRSARMQPLETSLLPRPERSGPTTWLVELEEEGFFRQPKSTNDVVGALAEKGHHVEAEDVTWQLRKLVEKKVLRRKKEIPEGATKPVWLYSTW